MELLIIGLLLWSSVHFIPSIGISFKASLVARLGEKPYAATFALLIVLSLVLMVLGWRSTTPEYLYTLPAVAKPVALVLLVTPFFLLGAANYVTRVKRFIRHPQLTGVATWAIAHLLINGDSRSVVLFGGLALWAILEMIFINKREGQWIKPESPSWSQEIKGGLISLVVLAVVIFIHPYIAGVPVR